jgi:RES domain-containing protein
MQANDVPPEFTLLKIEGPDLDVPSVSVNTLPDDWRTKLEITRDLGTSWLETSDTVLLRVPSAIVPETMNYLFNPAHRKAAEFHIVEVIAYPFDARLKK